MKHLYNSCLPVFTGLSLKRFQSPIIGANEHSNIVGEWSAVGYSLLEIIWTADENPNEIFGIEVRQDC